MITIKTNNQIVTFLKSAKELKRLSLAYSIPCNVVKFLGKYDIIYSDKTSVQTNCRNISDISIKQWYELMLKNMPPNLKQGETGILYNNLIKKVNESTI